MTQTSAASTAQQLTETITGTQLTFHNENTLQQALTLALAGAGFRAEREVVLGGSLGRIDLVCGRIGLEVKIGGTWQAVVRQLMRYARSNDLDELMLVTDQACHHRVPSVMNGKPVHLVTLIEAGL